MTLFKLIESDLYRYAGKKGLFNMIMGYLKHKGFRFTFWMRITKKLEDIPIVKLLPMLIFKLHKVTYSTDLDYRWEVGPGLCLYHVFGTAAHETVKIGQDVTICHNVTLGRRNDYFPSVGDRVYISPGAVIIGKIHIGNDSLIAPNALVLENIPPNSIVMGNPAKVVSTKGSKNYIKFCSGEYSNANS